LLAARDERQASLARVISQRLPATVFVSLNIPGAVKTPPGAEAFYDWMLGQLSDAFPPPLLLEEANDPLGPYAIMAFDIDPYEVKERCIRLETMHPSARLIDLDVYSAHGVQIDRSRLDLPGRACLVCAQPAVECIRVKRHSLEEVIGRTNELLAPFRT
jgi:holo-ACP synthase CitX